VKTGFEQKFLADKHACRPKIFQPCRYGQQSFFEENLPKIGSFWLLAENWLCLEL